MFSIVRVYCPALVLVVLAGIVAPVQVRPAAAIAFGDDAPGDAYRFSVLLTMTGLPTAEGGTRDSSCSGALIAARWVITAGHCFRDRGGRRVSRPVAARTTATVGRADLRGRDGHEVEVVAVHQSTSADVALAELASDVPGITPLEVGTAPPAVGEAVRLTGYGLTVEADAYAPAARLQTGQFVLDRVGDSVLEISGTAPNADTSPCEHDSGGPYFRERPDGTAVLVGAVSTGPGCPHPGPDIGARTDNLGSWIAGTTSGAGPLSRFPRPVLLAGLAGLGTLGLFLAGRRRATRHHPEPRHRRKARRG